MEILTYFARFCAATNSDKLSDQYYLTPTDGCEGAFKEPSLEELARVIKAGACIEASFKRGKGEVGMDEYQVRTWQGWPPYGVVTDRRVVLDRGNAPGSTADTRLDATTGPIRAEPAPPGSILHAWRGLYLPSSPAAITAQRVGEILPSSHP